ncbi:MAG: hypothetical protein BWX80_03554 [Candidatus Hydrogenedentes bacterium ADurb.Bin101]|nr:MAG: hypothetical protein BWX80_03554 [Candidatus Hydrogenedentes bacterium ADurb.Bin101]
MGHNDDKQFGKQYHPHVRNEGARHEQGRQYRNEDIMRSNPFFPGQSEKFPGAHETQEHDQQYEGPAYGGNPYNGDHKGQPQQGGKKTQPGTLELKQAHGRPPNRRLRDWYSTRVSCKRSRLKSGHKVGVTTISA